jgi:hypothetical protein
MPGGRIDMDPDPRPGILFSIPAKSNTNEVLFELPELLYFRMAIQYP